MPSQAEIYDKLVEDYAKNPDQGIKFCKKKLQKSPWNNTYLLAQACFLRDLNRPQDALTLCDTIKTPKDDPLEPDIIVTIQNVIRDCKEELGTHDGVAGPKIAMLWKDCLDIAQPFMQKKLRGEMLYSALRCGYWDLAPQLFARLQRESPQNVKYHFAWVASCQIQADKLPEGDRMASSLRMLASRSLKSVVDNTLAKKDTPKVLSSSADLRLLCQIYYQQGLLSELVEVLDSTAIGITSDVGKNDVEFVTVKMNALEQLKRWRELREFCLRGLTQLCEHYEAAGKITSDVPNELAWALAWQPWKTTLNATLEESGTAEDMFELAKRYLDIDPHHRNAGNAVLLHHYLFAKDKLLDTCQTFFDAHSTRVSCFDDLKQVAEGLQCEQKGQFCDFLSAASTKSAEGNVDKRTQVRQATSKINALKLHYLLYFSDMEARDDAEIAAFIAQCLHVYQSLSGVEDRPSDDACVLAIAALMKFGSVKSNIYNLQAAVLSYLLRDNSQWNFQATLLQLANARILGLGSIAIGAFRDLNVQEVQLDTLGHLLYTRLSTLHPWPVSLPNVQALDERSKNPKASLLHAMQYARRGTDAVLSTLTKDLDNVYFDKLYEFVQFDDRLAKSYSIMQYRLELHRMRRLTGDSKATTEIPKTYSFKSSDNRDFGAIVNFEPATSRQLFQDIVTGGYKPSTYWAVRWQVNEIVQVLLATRPASLSENQNRTVDSLLQYLQVNARQQEVELTPTEQETCARWNKLTPLTIWLVLGPKHLHASVEIKQDLASLTEYLSIATLAIQAEDMDVTTDDRLEFTHFTELESWYLHLEFAKACSAFITAAMALRKQKGHHAANGLAVDALNKLQKGAKNLADAVQKQARTLQQRLKKDGKAKVLAVVKSGGLGGVIGQLVGEGELRMYVDEMVESAVEGLEGVLKVKVP